MLAGFRNVLRPAAFHGHGRRPPFFEGWYYKLVDADAQGAMAVIPGVFFARDRTESHCFVQIFDGRAGRAWYQRYPIEDFWAHPNRFEVRVGPNRFSLASLTLNISNTELSVQGRVELGPAKAWPVTISSPGVMGPFAWLPFLECYHGLLSFDHALAGGFELEGETRSFDAGRGYLEKDWGSSFPSSWIWCQCNHFPQAGVSVSASIAEIPNLGRSFPGFIVGLQIDEQLHAFTTHNLSRIEVLRADEHEVAWTLTNKTHRLTLLIERAEATRLPGPRIDGMKREVHETLRARVDLRLSIKASGELVYEGRGICAGLEVQGTVESLARIVRGPV